MSQKNGEICQKTEVKYQKIVDCLNKSVHSKFYDSKITKPSMQFENFERKFRTLCKDNLDKTAKGTIDYYNYYTCLEVSGTASDKTSCFEGIN